MDTNYTTKKKNTQFFWTQNDKPGLL